MYDLTQVWPEIFVATMACIVLVVDLYVDRKYQLTYWLSMATLVGAAALTLALPAGVRSVTLTDAFVAEPLTDVLKMVAYGVVALVFLYSRDYLRERELLKGEYFVLGLFGLLGIMVMASAHHFLTLYLGLELLSLSLYAMVAFDRDSSICAESAMKYFVLGAIASGALLYGMSLVYGVTGTLDLQGVAEGIAAQSTDLRLLIALAFMIVGVAFKLGAVPFHMWVPDVYHGAPTSTTLYIGSAAKIASFALFVRAIGEGFVGMESTWQDMLIVLAVLSLAIGNVVAIAQTNLKRMLAYSTISHVGFILLGFIAADAQGYQAALFYTVTYVLMAAGAFGMIILLSRAGFEADELADFKGLNHYSPWFALIMLLLMFSMAGVPPLVGFYAKLAVIAAVLDAGLTWLAIVAVVFSVIGAYYYLRVIKLMYFDEPEGPARIDAALGMRVVLSANGLAMLALGVFPGALLALCGAVVPLGLR